MRRETLTGLSLDKAFLGFMVLGAFVFFGVTVFFISNRVEALQDDLVRSVVEIRGNHVAMDIVHHLDDHWVDLENLATVLPFSDRMMFRNFLTREVADGQHMSWAAYVSLQGEVLLASRQTREGESVAGEDWFIRAQAGPMVAYSTDARQNEVLILSLPVTSTAGISAGFLTFQFRPEWFEAKLGEIAKSLAVDVIVLDSRGIPVLHSLDVDAVDMDQMSIRNALAGQKVTTLESWPKLGQRYAISLPDLPASLLPPIGWRLVVLTGTEQFPTETRKLQEALSEILAAVALLLLLMSVGFIRIFLVPLHRMVLNAHEIADGAEVLPIENHRTAELSLLSSALARLQGRMLRAEDRVAELEEQAKAKPNGDQS